MMIRKIQIAVGVAFLLAVAGVIGVALRAETPYREWESRDGTLIITVQKSWLASHYPVMPGHGGDVRGTVTVTDKATGETLLRQRVPMVNMAEDFLGDFRER